MVDAPVSGSVITLQQGKLSVMVGGKAATFDRVKPLLDDVGPKVTHVGDNGLALSMKIAINLSLMSDARFSEGVLLADKSGIAREVAVDVLTHSVIGSPMCSTGGLRPEHARRSVVRRQHDAEGHAARPRNGPAARRAAADDRDRQRDVDRGHEAWAWRIGISRSCSRCWPKCQGFRQECGSDHGDEEIGAHSTIGVRPSLRMYRQMSTVMAQGTFYDLDAPVTRLVAMRVPDSLLAAAIATNA